MNNRNLKISRWFAAGAVFCCLIAIGMVAMMVSFARDPASAPPGILRGVFLAAPALLLVVIIVSMILYVKQLREENEK